MSSTAPAPAPVPPAPTTPETAAASPLFDANWMARLIADVTGEPPDVATARLRAEYARPGSTVSADFARRGLRRYEWGEGLIRFYRETDGFLYELAVWNRNPFKLRMRQKVVKYLAARAAESGTALRVLCVGDGLGFDSLELSRAGHDVTYYDLPGRTETFARRLFAETGADVTVITDPANAVTESFDAVICLDVLEHAPDPSAVIQQIVAKLRPGGCAVFSAPFFLILPWFPTHLKTNRVFSGNLWLYHRHGLRLVDGSLTWDPLVFHKPTPTDPGRPNPWKVPLILLLAPFLAVGRCCGWPFMGSHLMRRLANRWFEPPRGRLTSGGSRGGRRD